MFTHYAHEEQPVEVIIVDTYSSVKKLQENYIEGNSGLIFHLLFW